MLNNCGEAFNLYLPSTLKKLVTTWTINCKIFLGALCFLVYDQVQGLDTERQYWFLSKTYSRTSKVSMGGMLALLKYPFYPLFNFDNGMNLISKSLTILTSGQLLVVFTFAHIFWRYFVFAGFWPILEHEMARPTITRWHEEWRRPKPEQRVEGHDNWRPIHAHPPSNEAQKTKPTR